MSTNPIGGPGGSSCRALVVVNDAQDIKVGSTTEWLIARGRSRGWQISTAGVHDFGLGSEEQRLVSATDRRGVRTSVDIAHHDLVMCRTNPARDAASTLAHGFAMRLLGDANAAGVPVLNTPRGLLRADSKAFLLEFSERIRPPMIVTQNVEDAFTYRRAIGGDAVMKPAHGTHGIGVIRVQEDSAETRAQVATLLGSGPLVVQPFLPEAAQGDTRVIVMDGQILAAEGHFCAVRRRPSPNDFRSNVAAGGTAACATLTPAMVAAVDEVRPILQGLGLWLVGLDFVGARVIEVNAYSPGGLPDAAEFEGVDFGAALFEGIERHLTTQAVQS
jgi:glutathione synthase